MTIVEITAQTEFTGNKYLNERATEMLKMVGGQNLTSDHLTAAMGEMHGFEDRPRFLYDLMGMLSVYDVRTHMRGAQISEVFYDEDGLIGLKVEGETDVRAIIIQPQDENTKWGTVAVVEKNNFVMATPGTGTNEVGFYQNWDTSSVKALEHTSAMVAKLGVDIDTLTFPKYDG
jgi:hypothetical protein